MLMTSRRMDAMRGKGDEAHVKRQTRAGQTALHPISHLACEVMAVRIPSGAKAIITSQARWLIGVALLLLACLAGCSSHRASGSSGPTRRAPVSVALWSARPAPATVLSSPRYTVYT